MRSIRNVALALVLAAVYWSPVGATNQEPEYDCPENCTCDIDPWNIHLVTIECPEDYPTSVCGEIWLSCVFYCDDMAVFHDQENPQYSHWCEADLPGEDCWPHSLEEGTSEICSCTCWGT